MMVPRRLSSAWHFTADRDALHCLVRNRGAAAGHPAICQSPSWHAREWVIERHAMQCIMGCAPVVFVCIFMTFNATVTSTNASAAYESRQVICIYIAKCATMCVNIAGWTCRLAAAASICGH